MGCQTSTIGEQCSGAMDGVTKYACALHFTHEHLCLGDTT